MIKLLIYKKSMKVAEKHLNGEITAKEYHAISKVLQELMGEVEEREQTRDSSNNGDNI